jgi:hypothetical protein
LWTAAIAERSCGAESRDVLTRPPQPERAFYNEMMTIATAMRPIVT